MARIRIRLLNSFELGESEKYRQEIFWYIFRPHPHPGPHYLGEHSYASANFHSFNSTSEIEKLYSDTIDICNTPILVKHAYSIWLSLYYLSLLIMV